MVNHKTPTLYHRLIHIPHNHKHYNTTNNMSHNNGGTLYTSINRPLRYNPNTLPEFPPPLNHNYNIYPRITTIKKSGHNTITRGKKFMWDYHKPIFQW